MIKGVNHAHLGPIWYLLEHSDVPYSPNLFLGLDFFATSYRKTALVKYLPSFLLLPQKVCHPIVRLKNNNGNANSFKISQKLKALDFSLGEWGPDYERSGYKNIRIEWSLVDFFDIV